MDLEYLGGTQDPPATTRGRLGSKRGRGDSADAEEPPRQVIALSILYTNAQSLAGKVSELEAIASDMKPDIIALTETWCNSGITNAVLSIVGYELVPDLRMDRADTGGGRGGGLIVYARSGKQV